MSHVSFSNIATLATCPHRHWLRYHVGLQVEGSWWMEYGKAIHEDIHDIHTYLTDQGEVPPEWWDTLQGRYDRLQETIDAPPHKYDRDWGEVAREVLRLYHRWITSRLEEGCTILMSEGQVMWDLDGTEVLGYVDLLLETPTGERVVYDIKTGSNVLYKVKPAHRLQTTLYAMRLDSSRIGIVSLGYAYKHKAKLNVLEESITPVQKEVVKALIAASIHYIHDNPAPPPLGVLNDFACSYCSYKSHCEYYRDMYQEGDDD